MTSLLDRILEHARRTPDARAVEGSTRTLTYGELKSEVQRYAGLLDGERIGILADNGPDWMLLDLAILARRATCIPLPTFFSADQLRHVIHDAGIDCIITDRPDRLEHADGIDAILPFAPGNRALWKVTFNHGQRAALPPGTIKITYTSGTTGQPKGVCLYAGGIAAVADSLVMAANAADTDVTLSLLPLSTLLENIGGVYVPLLAGATCCLPNLADVGLQGSSSVDLEKTITALNRFRPTAIIVTPELLQGVMMTAAAGARLPASLRFVAVGGAPVPAILVQNARDSGLPAYVGYGLSEAASVVSLNRPGYERPGSVGRVLPHLQLRVGADGEILLRGQLFGGYLGKPARCGNDWYATGDIGYVDEDGFLFITGRRRNVFITGHGRNVSPEWPEQELMNTGVIRHAVTFGEGRPFNTAVIVPLPGTTPTALEQAIQTVNSRLPDYARVPKYVVSNEAFTRGNRRLTASGQPDRERIQVDFKTIIDAMYQ